MLTSLMLLAAVLCWPPSPAFRLRAVRAHRGLRRRRKPSERVIAAAAVVTVAVAGWVLLGPAGAVVGGLAGVVTARRLRARRQRAAEAVEYRVMAEALGGLVAELRAGAHPAAAAESVAADVPEGTGASRGLRAVAAAARLGGDADIALADAAQSSSIGAELLHRVARAWRLAQEHGVPLAPVLDAVRRDVEATARFADHVHAKLAGPRASAAVLACLPLVGIVLGEVMGAAPVRVLSSTPAGQALLMVGSLLVFAGMSWVGRLTRKAVTG